MINLQLYTCTHTSNPNTKTSNIHSITGSKTKDKEFEKIMRY